MTVRVLKSSCIKAKDLTSRPRPMLMPRPQNLALRPRLKPKTHITEYKLHLFDLLLICCTTSSATSLLQIKGNNFLRKYVNSTNFCTLFAHRAMDELKVHLVS